MLDRMQSLAATITRNVARIDEERSQRGLAPLDLDAPVSTDAALLPSLGEGRAREQVLAAASELTALVDHPVSRLAKLSSAYLDVAVLHFAADHGIPDVIEEEAAGPDADTGMSGRDIARRINTNPVRTIRLLRYLTALHVFRETTEGCFANNVYSLQFKRGSPLQAVFGMGVHDVGPAALRINEYMRTPDATGSLPLNIAFDCPGKSMFEWMNGDAGRLDRFNRTMVMKNHDSHAVVTDLPWNELLPRGGTLVDVGGGVGSLAHSVQVARPDIHAVVLDQQDMIDQAADYWAKHSPQALAEGRTRLVPHDFFREMPVEHADLYVFRAIFHNWSDESCAAILRALLPGMGPRSRILVIDAILQPLTTAAPGSVNELRSDTQQDITMMTLFPSLERTRQGWDTMLRGVGLEVKRVFEVRSRKRCFEIGPCACACA